LRYRALRDEETSTFYETWTTGGLHETARNSHLLSAEDGRLGGLGGCDEGVVGAHEANFSVVL